MLKSWRVMAPALAGVLLLTGCVLPFGISGRCHDSGDCGAGDGNYCRVEDVESRSCQTANDCGDADLTCANNRCERRRCTQDGECSRYCVERLPVDSTGQCSSSLGYCR